MARPAVGPPVERQPPGAVGADQPASWAAPLHAVASPGYASRESASSRCPRPCDRSAAASMRSGEVQDAQCGGSRPARRAVRTTSGEIRNDRLDRPTLAARRRPSPGALPVGDDRAARRHLAKIRLGQPAPRAGRQIEGDLLRPATSARTTGPSPSTTRLAEKVEGVVGIGRAVILPSAHGSHCGLLRLRLGGEALRGPPTQ